MTAANTGVPKLAFSIKEVCQATSLSRSCVYNHISAKRLRTTRISGRVIVLADDLAAFLTGQA